MTYQELFERVRGRRIVVDDNIPIGVYFKLKDMGIEGKFIRIHKNRFKRILLNFKNDEVLLTGDHKLAIALNLGWLGTKYGIMWDSRAILLSTGNNKKKSGRSIGYKLLLQHELEAGISDFKIMRGMRMLFRYTENRFHHKVLSSAINAEATAALISLQKAFEDREAIQGEDFD